MLKTVAVFILFGKLLSFSQANAAASACGLKYDVSEVLQTPQCSGVAVHIFSENNHYASDVIQTRESILAYAFDKQIIGIFEGEMAYKKSSTPFARGSEVRQAKALSAIIFTPLLEKIIGAGEIMSSSEKTMMEKLVQSAFGEMVGLWPEITHELLSSKKTTDEVRGVAEKLLLFLTKPGQSDFDLDLRQAKQSADSIRRESIQRFGTYQSLLSFTKAWYQVARAHITDVPGLEFLKTGPEGSLLGEGRSIIFVREVLRAYCDAAKLGIPIWLSIGAGHLKEVQCLLRERLPLNTELKTISSTEIPGYYDDWVASFLSSDALKQFKILVSQNGSAVMHVSKLGPNAFLMLSKEPSAADREAFLNFFNKTEYRMLRGLSNGRNLFIEKALPQR